ncbi:hypothetical protein DXT99_24800 [Pontibacter diazotrophicus]|uniref:HipA-like kinase domain-containing protein n=1 Tax=Pontibacter diazotrophicus TaxID=1400979 RepID=A0A3D8L1T0_9BACT|nr:HipA family kinase [Pontibacter diazotrophicus]RDV11325.1 hypothetical protein DXT99_24800 [Pontibacter diazotrophicus]
MQAPQVIEAIKIIREIGTEGSAPLLVTGNDFADYYAKPIRTPAPCIEIINEFLCSNLLDRLGLKTPEIRLIKIDYDLTEGKNLSNRYRKEYFDKPFFGSKSISGHIEIETYFRLFNRRDLSLFAVPEDIIKIGFFDLWVGNKDRKPSNANVIISENEAKKFELHPIDHGAAFCYMAHREVSDVRLWLNPSFSILTTPMAKIIAKEVIGSEIDAFGNDNILRIINLCKENFNDVLASIPKDLGFSKKASKHLEEFLFNDKRNAALWERSKQLLA